MFRICSQWAILSAVVLAGCVQPTPVSDADRVKVENYIRKQQAPLSVTFLPMWYAEGEKPTMICGEIVAPPQLQNIRDRLRYIYYLNTRKPDGAIELHEMVVAGDARGEQIIVEGRRVFDRAWEMVCAPAAPSSIGRWWRGTTTAGDGGSDTPLTNGYVGDLLEKAR